MEQSTYIPESGVALFALLIGIDQYENPRGFRPLSGSVNDVHRFKEYLVHRLRVPDRQIKLLCNEAATRRGIIQAFKELANDRRIKQDDAIVIYFAGHGAQITAPPRWECSDPRRKIQSIASYDFCDTPDHRVPPIPDRILNHLLARISQKHGRNITVIFDCCYSGSGTRGEQIPAEDESSLVARGIDLDLSGYPDDLDHDILSDESADESTRAPVFLPEFDHFGLESHILLAACASKELANEGRIIINNSSGSGSTYSGLFSSALLRLLYRVPPQYITYSDILSRLEPIQGQSPQCEGTLKDRPLFGTKLKIPTTAWKSFNVSYRHGNNRSTGYYEIAAGKFHNITESTEFAVYYENDVTRPICILRVTALREFHAIAQPISTHGGAYVDITAGRWGEPIAIPTVLDYQQKLQIWFNPTSRSLEHLYQRITQRHSEHLRNVHRAASEDVAEIKIFLETQNRVSLEIFTTTALLPPRLGLKWKKGNIATNDDFLPFALSQAANFYSELKRPDNDTNISARIEIEFYELREDSEDVPDLGLIRVYRPSTYQNLYQNGVVRLNMSDSRRRIFGLKLTNKTRLDLYVNMYMFLNESLSIVEIVRTDNKSPYMTDISLPAYSRETSQPGSLTIGYGAAGYRPLSFKPAEHEQYDVDYLKIYLSTQPVDVSYVRQDSPFRASKGDCRAPVKGHRATTAWSHIVIPIVQQR